MLCCVGVLRGGCDQVGGFDLFVAGCFHLGAFWRGLFGGV